MNTFNEHADLICFSHLRWDFVFQRPQHLMTRFGRSRRVFYVEEPVFEHLGESYLEYRSAQSGVLIVVPHVRKGGETNLTETLRDLVQRLIFEHEIHSYFAWYYTPMAHAWTEQLKPVAVVYDCMDELSAFRGASPELRQNEKNLLRRADLVFTGGQTLFEAKRHLHPHVYCFPSSIDHQHFARARERSSGPDDQASIPGPKIGFCGVIDERMDLDLIRDAASLRPDWQFIMIGPTVKIAESDLPRAENIHYLGMKKYEELPEYMSGWNAAILPFARNESTRFISPTKTPEYLAAGLGVVSTSIRDVIRPYGEMGLVRIADSPVDFVDALEDVMSADSSARLRLVDSFLAANCWSRTWRRMSELMDDIARAQMRQKPSSSLAAMAASASSGHA